MDAIVLVGGLGTRLRSLVSEVPKPMAPVGEVPFLDILLARLLRHRAIDRLVLAVGYKREVVQDYFGDRLKGREIAYAIETEPLGTGGGIRNAIAHARSDEVLVVNGDTLFDVDLEAMVAYHRQQQADLTLALKPMREFDRYGTVQLAGTRVVGFEEKRYQLEGTINGGIYLLERDLFERPLEGSKAASLPEKFSFETDFLERYLQQLRVCGFVSEGYFIDIGIPEDYRRAQVDLAVDLAKVMGGEVACSTAR